MQVFLPYADLQKSVCCLDNSRLGNQIYREAKTLILGGWPNHPVSKMWKGYEYWLATYCLYGLEELTKRGKFYPHHIAFFYEQKEKAGPCNLPLWFGDQQFHASHRSALLSKNYDWYSQFGWTEEPGINYYWPEN